MATLCLASPVTLETVEKKRNVNPARPAPCRVFKEPIVKRIFLLLLLTAALYGCDGADPLDTECCETRRCPVSCSLPDDEMMDAPIIESDPIGREDDDSEDDECEEGAFGCTDATEIIPVGVM